MQLQSNYSAVCLLCERCQTCIGSNCPEYTTSRLVVHCLSCFVVPWLSGWHGCPRAIGSKSWTETLWQKHEYLIVVQNHLPSSYVASKSDSLRTRQPFKPPGNTNFPPQCVTLTSVRDIRNVYCHHNLPGYCFE